MRLPNFGIPNIFRRREPEQAPVKWMPEPSLVEKVWDSPVDYNRATRRAAKLYSRIWSWNRQVTAQPMLPRYARRHAGVVAIIKAERTRRERRHYARLTRSLTRLGLA